MHPSGTTSDIFFFLVRGSVLCSLTPPLTLPELFQDWGHRRSANSSALPRYSSALRPRPPQGGPTQSTPADSTMLPRANATNPHLPHLKSNPLYQLQSFPMLLVILPGECASEDAQVQTT